MSGMKFQGYNWDRIYIFYYLVLAIVFFVILKPFSSISMFVRIVSFCAVFFPVFFRIKLFLPVFIFFVTISTHSFFPILPTQYYFYLILVAFVLLISKRFRPGNWMLFLIPLYCILNDFFHSTFPSWAEWIFVMFFLSFKICDEKDIDKIALAFMLVSIFLSLLYIVNFSEFELVKHVVEEDEDYSTSGWLNHNKFDSALACGALMGVATMLGYFHLKKTSIYKVVAIAAFVLTVIVMILDVSRGSIISLFSAVALLILFSKHKLKIKLFIIFSLVVLLCIAIAVGATDYAQSRFTDSGMATAGKRSLIWERKITLFLAEMDLVKLLFGLGWDGCLNLGGFRSTHNDWITAFIAFGIVGVFGYLMLYIYPVFKYGLKNRMLIAVLIFLLLESMVLEPFFRGNAQMVLMYIFAVKYAAIMKKTKVTMVKKYEQ